MVLDVPEERVTYPLDAAWFKRALDNLIANAAIHNPPETRIRLTLEIRGEKEGLSYPGLLFRVEDNGRGMDAESVTRLFDRYYRGTRTGSEQGTGLGMAIARQLVEAHGGEIRVETQPGSGTRVEVLAPEKLRCCSGVFRKLSPLPVTMGEEVERMSETLVQTVHLTRRYGSQAVVDGLNLKVKRGEVYGFLGPNGAGKTTTIRMLLGLIRPTSGEIEMFGQPLEKNRKQILRRVGALVESPSYYGHLTGRENLEVTRRLLGVPKQRIDEVLERVRLRQAADKKVKQYSLGMKQRLGIALALLGEPDLLILDEPTNGLDPPASRKSGSLSSSCPVGRMSRCWSPATC